MNRIINWVFGSFFRTLGRILVYILIGYLLFNLINLDNIRLPIFNLDRLFFMDVHADIYKDINVYGYLNGTKIYEDDNMDDFTKINNARSLSANVEPQLKVSIEDYVEGATQSRNYFLIVTYCSTAYPTLNNAVTGGVDLTNASLIANYSVNNYGLPCKVGSYDGNIYQGIFALTRSNITSSSSFSINIWGGHTFDYVTWYQFQSITLQDYSEELANSYQSLKNQSDIISSQNSNSQSQISNATNNANNIINNQNSNSQAEISNNNQQQGWNRENATNNANNIINNQNANSQAEINSQKVCNIIDKNAIVETGKQIISNGNIQDSQTTGLTDYIKIDKNTEIKIIETYNYYGINFYNINKVKISTIAVGTLQQNEILTIPNDASYVRFSIHMTNNKPQFQICKNGNQATNDTLNDMNNNLTNDNINEQGTNDFVNGLNHEYSSLTPFSDFINLPLTWIQSLLSSNQNCQPIELPLPFVNKNLTLPCMTEFWNSMGLLKTLIELVWIAVVGVRIFNGLFLLTCDTLDPNPDKDMTRLRTWEL